MSFSKRNNPNVVNYKNVVFLTSAIFFKIFGNYGLAIIAVTFCIRLAVFPLANYSFRSMAKMKVLQPEMVRLKELHKDDKMKLQQAMMALYKKEKVEENLFVKNIIVNKDKRKKQYIPFIATEKWIDQLGNRLQVNS